MKKFSVLAMSASVLALTATPSFADYTLNILHINDWHSRIEPINRYDSTCSPEDDAAGECFGGAARLVSAVSQQRAAHEGENLIFLNAGDNFQGSLFYTTYKGTVEAEFLNLMDTDAMVVGNHEFDDGEDGLAAFLGEVEFPVLGSNVKASEASALGDRVREYVILDVGGEKIGIVGAVANDTAELSSPGENVSIIEDVEGITQAVEAVAAEGVNKIIALTHVGYPRDLAAIAKIPGVDVVVGGHTNTLLSNTIEGAAGPYPTMVDNPEGYQVPVVQAAAYSKYLGGIEIVFNDEGVVTEASGEPILIDASIEPDQQVVERVAELAGPIEELKNKVVSEAAAPIDGSRENCRAGECQMGNLVTDAMLAATEGQGVDFAITNGGGLRASIDAGEITMGEVLEVLPFQNTLATFQLKGADVVASLESGVSQIEEGAGRFPQVSGLRYSFDPSAEPGSRISDVEVQANGEWAPIDADATYTIASNNFMRGGGDGYALFAENAMNAYDYGPGLEQVVADYLAENQPYEPYTDGRITEVSADADMAMDDEMAEEGEPEMAESGEAEPMDAEATGEEMAAEPMEGEADTMAEDESAMADEGMAEEDMAADEMTAEDDTASEPMDGEATEMAAEEEPAMADEGMADEEMAKDDMASEPMEGEATEMAAEEEPAMAEEGMAEEKSMMESEAAMERTHTIMRGDTYWDLARQYYDDPRMWRMLADANPHFSARGLEVGATLTVPPAK